MSTETVRLERRAGQRFEVNLPIAIEYQGRNISAFSHNLSARGVFLFSEAELPMGATVQLIFTMPSEITLAESMRMRCRGRVLRSSPSGSKQGNAIAVQFEAYQYLPARETKVEVTRVGCEKDAVEPSRALVR